MSRFAWLSRKGLGAVDNRDFGGCVSGDGFWLGVVVDASSKGPDGAGFANALASSVLTAASVAGSVNSAKVLSDLRCQHDVLRFQYLHETASYAVAGVSPNNEAWAIVCGDCRVGVWDGGQHKWITPVHTVANVWGGELDKATAVMSDRHVLTRCWNAKRFVEPQCVQFNTFGQPICIASDGYWLEYLLLEQAWGALEDDASCLFQTDGFKSEIQTDAKNFLLL